MKRGITLDDLPPAYREQARRQLAAPCAAKVQCSTGNIQCSSVQIPVEHSLLNIETSARTTPARRTPNDTEQRFRDDCILNEPAHYEALTFRLPGGSRYTPDWVWWKGGRLHVAEVKGKYKFHSENRARTAFTVCASSFPGVVFIWSRWTGREWQTETFNLTSNAVVGSP